MRFRVLGPMRVWDGNEWAAIRAAQQRTVLALLLIESGRPVTSDRLIDEIWEGRPPATAMGTIHGYVLKLRRLLGDDHRTRLVTQGHGYQLMIESDDLDIAVFDRLVESGRQNLASGDLETGVAELAEALALWRGTPLADIPACATVCAEAQRLQELHVTALEECLGAQLELGRHAEVVDQLRRLVREHPLRETLWRHLLLALHRCGRRAEALDAYQRARQLLVDELGVEPDRALRDLHLALLTEDPRLGAPRPQPRAPAFAPVVPAQLPADIAGFTGRRNHLERLDALLPAEGNAPVIVTVVGPAGVGKTALTVHWAHRAREHFPDGQLFVNLQGYSAGAPLRPIQALARFLRALGVPASQVPTDTDEAAAQLRSLLAERRVLVVLDDANHPDHVRPLLPNGSGCLVVITSRERLGGLIAREGAVRIGLEVLEAAEAHDLLAGLIGPARVAAEPDATQRLASLCGYLPLALRIAAANLVAQPKPRIAGYTELLSAGRLAELSVDDDEHAAIRVAFDHSYASLPEAAQRMFRLLGPVPGVSADADAAAALAGVAPVEAARLLDRLASAHLVEEETVPGRYVMHDLIREYAAQRAGPEESRNALAGLYSYYAGRAAAAADRMYPHVLRIPVDSPQAGFDGASDAAAWLDAERANLVAAATRAAEDGFRPVAWRLADTLRGYLYLRMGTEEWRAVAEAGLAAAEADGQSQAQAAALSSLGTLHWAQGRHAESIEAFRRALALARACGWVEGEAAALGNLGNLQWAVGHLDEAAEHYRHALAVHEEADATPSQATALGNLGLVYFGQGDLARAEEHHSRALLLHRKTGSRSGEARTLSHLGEVYHAQDRLEEALAALEESLRLTRTLGDRNNEGDALRSLAAVLGDLGRTTHALEVAGEAVALARENGDRRLEAGALTTRADVHLMLGQVWTAVSGHCDALRIARDVGDRYLEAEALIGLAAAETEVGQEESATDLLRQALAIGIAGGYGLLIDRAKRAQIAH